MKKIKYLMCLVVVMMFVSIMNVDAAGVSIKSIKLVDQTGNTTEVNEAVPNGLDIKFDLSFSDVGDTAKYEVVLNNPTDKEYEINTDKQFSKSNYISYSYELKDKTNRVKANSEVTVFITIKYENPVPTSSLVDGKYIESNTMGIDLLNENNPSTANNIIFIILIILGVIGFTFLNKFIKNKEYLIIIFTLLLVPVTVFALERLKLTVSTKITIEERYNVYYDIGSIVKKSDLNDTDYVYRDCNEIIKIEQENGTYEDFYECNTLYKKDSSSYRAGDLVEIKRIPSISLNVGRCYYSDDVYHCYKDAVNYDYFGICLKYKCYNDPEIQNANICDEESFNNMVFDPPIKKHWYGDYGYVNFEYPSKVTMPKGDFYIEHTSCK